MANIFKIMSLATTSVNKVMALGKTNIKSITGVNLQAAGDRGVFAGGNATNVIDYITISTPGNATDLGDLMSTVDNHFPGGCSNGASNRGLVFCSNNANTCTNRIEYFTISSNGNSSDFGDRTIAQRVGTSALSNGTNNRGCSGGGQASPANDSNPTNIIDYVTISTTGQAADFGDLVLAYYGLTGISNATSNKGVWGGYYPYNNIIQHVTITSLGNAVDFGDLTVGRGYLGGCSNGTGNRGIFGGGTQNPGTNVIDYITINSPGNATDFGDLRIASLASDFFRGGIASNNIRGVFGAGFYISNLSVNIMEYITILTTGNSADFGDISAQRYAACATSNT